MAGNPSWARRFQALILLPWTLCFFAS